MDSELKYDVAITFLASDQPTASALYTRLSEGLRVFFYPHNQEELAGTDGLQSMHTPFFEESRVVVVLYREPWGETPWTRIEATAIKERFLAKGWDFLFFMTLDKTSQIPIWLPQHYVRFSYPDFGLEQAVGAIKARVQDCGGKIEPMSALTRAKQVQLEGEYLREKDKLFGSMEWVRDTVSPSVHGLFEQTMNLCHQVCNAHGMSVLVAAKGETCVLTDDQVSLELRWRLRYVNRLGEGRLTAIEYKQRIPLPGRNETVWNPPEPLREHKFIPELSLTRELCWVDAKVQGQHLSAAQVADKCVQLFLDLVARRNRGEFEPNDFD